MKKLQLEIINRSKWPDPFINVVSNWMIKKSGLNDAHKYKWKYTILLRNYSKLHTFAGNANGREQTLRINRRFKPDGGYPYKYKDRRYKLAKELTFNNRIEVFIFLMSHEIHHSLEFNGVKHSPVSKRDINEFQCDNFAVEMIELFKKEWPKIKKEIISRLKILSLGENEALVAGDILAYMRKTGQVLSIEDVLIASSAITHNFIMVTANTRHFSKIKELNIENWLEPFE